MAIASQIFQNYIAGAWVASSDGKTFEQRNPANLDEVTGCWPSSTREDARRAIEAAQAAFPAWSSLSPLKRAEYLKTVLELMKARRDEIAMVITKENGKTLNESKAEIDSAIKEMEFQIPDWYQPASV
jgi:acyl-CoA reductase-like NAD-dependent aldehyde dehydrogenase